MVYFEEVVYLGKKLVRNEHILYLGASIYETISLKYSTGGVGFIILSL